MPMISILPLEELHRRRDARQLNDGTLTALSESINTIGLVNPIRVRRDDDGYEVIAGAHRFAACDLLGLREIACIIVDEDDLHAELAMIDENLCRAELSPADRAKQTARRKAIYEELHPDTAHGANLQGAGVANFATPESERFTAATAKVTGQSERAVQLNAERGEKVIDEVVNLIRGTKLDTGTYLDKLKKLTPNDQVQAARRDLAQTDDQPRGLARRVEQKPEPTYEQMRSAILLLADLKPADFHRLCPPVKRAAMFQQLARLEQLFATVREGVI